MEKKTKNFKCHTNTLHKITFFLSVSEQETFHSFIMESLSFLNCCYFAKLVLMTVKTKPEVTFHLLPTMCRLRSFVFAPSSEIFWKLNWSKFFPPMSCAGTERVSLTLVHFSFQMPQFSYIYKTYNWKCSSRALHPRDEKCLNQPSAREYLKFPVEQFGYFLTPTTSYPLAATLHLHFNFIITVDLVGKYETVKEEFPFIFLHPKNFTVCN